MRFSNLRNALLAALTVWGCSQRDDALRPDSPLYQFTQGQAVQTTTTVTVHSAANNFSSSVGTKAINSTGTLPYNFVLPKNAFMNITIKATTPPSTCTA